MISTTFIKHYTQSAMYAVVASVTIVSMLAIGFFIVEPQMSHGATTGDTRVRQTIIGETSLVVDPTVDMSSSISGLTGGNATGTAQMVITSNNAAGYYVEIDWFDNAGAHAMRGDEDGGAEIRDFVDNAGEPQYNFTASTAAQFAYAVYSSTTLDTDPSFLNNGSNTCNTGSTQTVGKCWRAPSTSPFRIVDRSSAATDGATSTIYFKVNVPSGANPTPTAQTYTATATLSVFEK
ncbi:MAG: hypothetical protein RL538_481 [Candidatus Parcubacteria bacterium]|jgi:hypothetical protein